METALRKGLASDPAAALPMISLDPETGLPVVMTPADAPISTMSIGEILELEQEALYQEDLQRAGLAP